MQYKVNFFIVYELQNCIFNVMYIFFNRFK